jgi:hypothetical protein
MRPRERTIEEIGKLEPELSSKYQDFKDLFIEKEGRAALLEYKSWDYEISIVEGKTSIYYRELIPLSKREEDFLKKYIKKQLEKGFIRPSRSSILYSILFAPKKNGSLRPYIN